MVLVSPSSSARSPTALAPCHCRGRVPFGTLYPFLGVTGDESIKLVRYTLDGKPHSATRRRPYPARAIRTAALSHGRHVLEAEIILKSGETRLRSARFSVARLFVAPGTFGESCTKVAPCGQFGLAFAHAAPGQVVEVAPGDYGSQTITGTKAPPGVTFKLVSGDAVRPVSRSMPAISRLRGRCGLGWATYPDAHHVTFKNVKHEGAFAIWSSDFVSLIGGESYCPRRAELRM